MMNWRTRVLLTVGGCWWSLFLACCGWSADFVLVAEGDEAQRPKQPQAVVDQEGNAHVVYGVGEKIFYARLTRDAAQPKFTAQVAQAPHLSLGMRRGPRIALSGETLVVTAIGGPQGKGRDGDIWAWTSVDEGTHWQGPVRVNDEVASAREGLHGLGGAPNGDVWCTWLDLRHQRTELYLAKSTDHGQTWQANQLVYRSPSGSICECCHPSIVVDAASVHILFRNSVDGQRDMYYATSATEKLSFTTTRLGTAHWDLAACPMDGGMLAVSLTGEVSTVWRRAEDVVQANAGGATERILGQGEQPVVAALGDRFVYAWTAGRTGPLQVLLPSGEQRRLVDHARDPHLAASSDGRHAWLCWESSENEQPRIEAFYLQP